MNLVVLFSLLALTGLVWAAWKQEGRLRRLEEQQEALRRVNSLHGTPAPAQPRKTGAPQ